MDNQNKSSTRIDEIPLLSGTPQAEFLKRISKQGEGCPKEYFWLEFRRLNKVDENLSETKLETKEPVQIDMSKQQILDWVGKQNPDIVNFLSQKMGIKKEENKLDWNNLRDITDEDVKNLEKLKDINFLVEEKKP